MEPIRPGSPDRAPTIDGMKKLLGREDIVAELKPIALAYRQLLKINKAALKKIDAGMVWTLVGGGTFQKSQFGPTRQHVALRGVVGTGPLDQTFNVEWVHADSLLAMPAATTWKGKYEASRLVLQQRISEDGAKLSFALSAEHHRNVPNAKHDNIVQAGVTFELPVGSAKLPISLNYANHEDLLTDQHRLAAFVGLAFDLSAFKKKSQAE